MRARGTCENAAIEPRRRPLEDVFSPNALQRHVLATLRVLFRPIVRLSLAHGVKFQQMTELLKVVLLDVAQADLRAEGRRVNASLLSVVTGLHRKDVNRLAHGQADAQHPAEPSIEAQVSMRWLTDAAFLDTDGRPRALARTGTAGASFETLARGVTSDVHPRAILDALLRLEMVAIDGQDRVVLRTERFAPDSDLAQRLGSIRDHNHDHLAASVANALGRQPPCLEHSLLADGLRPESVARLHDRAQAAWSRLLHEFGPVAEGMVRADRDQAGGAGRGARVRMGVYFYSEQRPARGAAADPGTPGDG